MPRAMSSSLGFDKLFFGPKHNIYAFFMILFGIFDLILLFVCQFCHLNCETKNWKYKTIPKIIRLKPNVDLLRSLSIRPMEGIIVSSILYSETWKLSRKILFWSWMCCELSKTSYVIAKLAKISNIWVVFPSKILCGLNLIKLRHFYAAPCPGPWVQASVSTNSFWFQAQHLCFLHDSIWYIWFVLLFVCQFCHLNCETKNWK